jgi:hypothetical protein
MANTFLYDVEIAVPADGSGTLTVSFGTEFATGSTPAVALTILNPGAWDGYQLVAELVGDPTSTGFTMIVSGGPLGSTIDVSWIAVGAQAVPTPPTPTPSLPYAGLYVNPQVLVLNPGTSENFTLTSPLGDLTTPTFSPDTSGQVTFTFVSGDETTQVWTATASADAYATTNVVIADTNSTATAYMAISIVPAQTATPTGYLTLDIIAQVRLRANEPNLPVNSDLLKLLNAGVQEIERRLGGIRLWGIYQTQAGQTVQALTSDIQEIIDASWSTGPPMAQGALVYPLQLMNQASFMDFAAGFPAVGFGPPTALFIYRDSGGTMEVQMYPAAMIGQLNIYYKARPIFWTLNPDGTNGTASNLDPAMQEAVVLWTVCRVLENRGRGEEGRTIFQPQLTDIIDSMLATVAKRSQPKSGQVRDVVSRGYPSFPWSWGRW